MAYKNLVNVTCANKKEAFCRIRDFLCKRSGTYDYSSDGIGWTLHDASYAADEDNPQTNDWFVLYSPGEGGKDDLYFKVTWVSANLKVEGFQAWDNSTHAGSANKYNISNNFTMADSGSLLIWVYGDLDGAVLVNRLTTSDYRVCLFEKCAPAYTDMTGAIAVCSSALTAGSDVSITVDAVPANWAVGKQVFIRTTHDNAMATVTIEKITIKTLDGDTITADLTHSYTADSALSDFVGYLCQGSANFLSTDYAFVNAAGSVGLIAYNGYNTGITATYVDPDGYENRVGLYDVFFTTAAGLPMVSAHVKLTPAHNAYFDAEDVLEEEDGTQWRCFHGYSNKYFACREV